MIRPPKIFHQRAHKLTSVAYPAAIYALLREVLATAILYVSMVEIKTTPTPNPSGHRKVQEKKEVCKGMFGRVRTEVYRGGICWVNTSSVRFGTVLNTLPNTLVWFGTNSISVLDTSAGSIRPPKIPRVPVLYTPLSAPLGKYGEDYRSPGTGRRLPSKPKMRIKFKMWVNVYKKTTAKSIPGYDMLGLTSDRLCFLKLSCQHLRNLN